MTYVLAVLCVELRVCNILHYIHGIEQSKTFKFSYTACDFSKQTKKKSRKAPPIICKVVEKESYFLPRHPFIRITYALVVQSAKK